MLDFARLNVAVIGTGVSGLAAAWLISRRHSVTVFEKENWIGGHCNTVEATLDGPGGPKTIPVDTGFIVYNENTYPNLTALFEHIGVATEPSNMSFSASVNDGRFEYAGIGLKGLLAQKRNLVRPRFWNMVWDILRFYREAVVDAARAENSDLTLGDYLHRFGYSEAFLRDHILPMASSIWSASLEEIKAYPLTAFVRFFSNHGLLETRRKNRPKWRTVTGGSREYVSRLTATFSDRIRTGSAVVAVQRDSDGVKIHTADGKVERFDQVVIAAHSNQALAMLSDPTDNERRLLDAIRYEHNHAVLHTDATLMPRRRQAWASWNYISTGMEDTDRLVCLTYWMNSLQNIDPSYPLFVTLNPERQPDDATVIARFDYEHPIFDHRALEAQRELWNIQGMNRTWYCGAYFGHGFHEDGLQAGLAVGEAVSGDRRPWQVENESGRIFIPSPLAAAA